MVWLVLNAILRLVVHREYTGLNITLDIVLNAVTMRGWVPGAVVFDESSGQVAGAGVVPHLVDILP